MCVTLFFHAKFNIKLLFEKVQLKGNQHKVHHQNLCQNSWEKYNSVKVLNPMRSRSVVSPLPTPDMKLLFSYKLRQMYYLQEINNCWHIETTLHCFNYWWNADKVEWLSIHPSIFWNIKKMISFRRYSAWSGARVKAVEEKPYLVTQLKWCADFLKKRQCNEVLPYTRV